MAQEWERPTAFGVSPAQPQMAAYALRPLSLGELLDRTFTVYRSRFWLFAGLGAISALLQTLLSAVQLLPMHLAGAAGATRTLGGPMATRGIPASPLSPNYLAGLGIGFLLAVVVLGLLYLLVFVVTQAATVYALSEVYLGNATTIGESLRATIGRWYRYLGIGLWQAGSMLWIPAVVLAMGGILLALKVTGLAIVGGLLIFAGIVGGVPVGFILWLRNSLGVQATVIEGLPVRASMARSKVLTAGAKGRIFVLILLAGALSYAAGLLQMPLMFIVMFAIARGGKAVGTEIAMLLVGFVGHAAVQPVLMIGLSLLYFDQRVRKEAFDLMMLIGPETVPVAALQPAIWPPVAAVETAVWPPPLAAMVDPLPVHAMAAEPISTESIGTGSIATGSIATEPIVSTEIEGDVAPRNGADDETLP